MLEQNKFYMMPVFNVDGSNLIEQNYLKTGQIVPKRTNMHILSQNCSISEGGVDLNRNFGYMFGQGDTLAQECKGDTFPGV